MKAERGQGEGEGKGGADGAVCDVLGLVRERQKWQFGEMRRWAGMGQVGDNSENY
jgi:hypothetical protein